MRRRNRDGIVGSLLPVLLGLAVSGCGVGTSRPDVPGPGEPTLPAEAHGLPQAYPRSQINDPRLSSLADEFQGWILRQRTNGSDSMLLFSKVEVLPTTQTVLPYGVGSYEQEPRLPVILTTGPGWSIETMDSREAIVAQVFADLSRRLAGLELKAPLRPTLTIQTSSGLELGWMNDLVPGRKNLHGDEEPVVDAPATMAVPAPPVQAAVDRRTDRRGDPR